jgi:hypothetical protein
VARRAMHPHACALPHCAPLLRQLRLYLGPGAMWEGSTKRPVEREWNIPAGRGPIQRAEPAASGRKVASVAEWNPPAS